MTRSLSARCLNGKTPVRLSGLPAAGVFEVTERSANGSIRLPGSGECFKVYRELPVVGAVSSASSAGRFVVVEGEWRFSLAAWSRRMRSPAAPKFASVSEDLPQCRDDRNSGRWKVPRCSALSASRCRTAVASASLVAVDLAPKR